MTTDLDPARTEETTASIDVEAAQSWRRRRPILSRVAFWGVIVWLFARVFSVDVSAIVTNDSVGYVSSADDPFQNGLISQGYRQVGYPLWLWFNDRVAGFFDWDRLFGIAMLQRTILLAALVVAWISFRWWSLPVLLLASAPTYVVHSDLALSEGLLIPSCLLVAAVATASMRHHGRIGRGATIYLAAMSTIVFVMAALKLQYAAFIVFVIASAAVLVRAGKIGRGRAVVPIVVTVVAICALALGQAIENRSETGVFEPVSEQARADWYGSYQVVFRLHPENTRDPDLAEFYDGGNLYLFLHGLESEQPDYRLRQERISARVEAMFAAAGTTSRSEQAQSFFGAFAGGRMDDIAGIINGSLRDDARPRSTYNGRVDQDLDRVMNELNNGRRPGELTLGPLADVVPAPVGDHRPWMRLAGPFSMVALTLCLFRRGEHRFFCAAALIAMCSVAGVLGSAYIDNARYLLGPVSAVVMTACAVMSQIARHTDASRALAAVRHRLNPPSEVTS